jgi:Mg-chelatase subunit ChlD
LAAVWVIAVAPGPAGAADVEPLALDDAPALERQTLDRLLKPASTWPRRAIGAMRLERYQCERSRKILEELLADQAWQVRAYALRTLGRRRIAVNPAWLDSQENPRVLRTALRHHYTPDVDRIGRGVRRLARSSDLEDKMLAVELAVPTGDEELTELARETARKVILRMKRSEAGSLSPRLAVMTGQPDMRRHYRWQSWLLKTGRRFALQPAYSIPEGDAPVPPSLLARLEPEPFAALERYIEQLSRRRVDLVICLDCTASMWGELAAAQGGLDDMMVFVGDVVASLRVALVAYRDRRDDFETKGWDFTINTEEARRHLWQLTAEGGGDGPEAVFKALKLAYTKLSWEPSHTKVLILVGDGPPHVGYGRQCADMAGRAARGELTTHVIQTEAKEVKHFPQIAEAGGGRCVSLEDDDLLIPEIAGLTLGDRFPDEFREFFQTYLELCR